MVETNLFKYYLYESFRPLDIFIFELYWKFEYQIIVLSPINHIKIVYVTNFFKLEAKSITTQSGFQMMSCHSDQLEIRCVL